MEKTFYDDLRGQFRMLCRGNNSISASAVFGSWARTMRPADKWSDLDLLTFVENPSTFIEDQEWLNNIGTVRIGFVEQNVFGCGVELRILFDGGYDVDFLFFPAQEMAQIISIREVIEWLKSGSDVLFDRDGNLTRLIRAINYTGDTAIHEPTFAEYTNLVADFFFHSVWTVKKLLRGELLTAKNCCDNYMKDILLRMVRWHTESVATGKKVDIHGNRFIESWAESWIIRGLSTAYAHYDEHDVFRSLDSTIRLFSRVAKETAEKLHFSYPAEYEEYSRELIKTYNNSR